MNLGEPFAAEALADAAVRAAGSSESEDLSCVCFVFFGGVFCCFLRFVGFFNCFVFCFCFFCFFLVCFVFLLALLLVFF